MYRLDEFSQAEIPEKLTFILERLNNHLVNQYQYAAILLHYLFIEVGFTLQTPCQKKMRSEQLPQVKTHCLAHWPMELVISLNIQLTIILTPLVCYK